MEPVTALAMDDDKNLRAAYVLPDPDTGQEAERKERVLGWAAVGGQVLPLRMDRGLGRLVIVGSEDDPHRDRFFGIVYAGERMDVLGEEVDNRIREMLRLEVDDDAEEDEDGDAR